MFKYLVVKVNNFFSANSNFSETLYARSEKFEFALVNHSFDQIRSEIKFPTYFWPQICPKIDIMSRSILFPIPFVPQKLRFGGHNFIWGQKFYLRAEMKNFWPQIKFCPPNLNFIPPNHVPKFCLANFNNNMGHKTTFGQIWGLKTVGNWISDLIWSNSWFTRANSNFLTLTTLGSKSLNLPL